VRRAQERLETLIGEVRACRICVTEPKGSPLPHDPRPVLRVSRTARLLICGQAPGTRVHASGLPFDDPSGDRLRAWLDVDRATFYDERRVAFLPMGFCFPGQDLKGGDLPPRPECAIRWHRRLMAALPQVEVVLLIGLYAQRWHLGREATRDGVTATVARWREIMSRDGPSGPVRVPLPHPSWRNTGWLRRHPWFEADLVPVLRRTVAGVLTKGSAPP